MSENNNGHSPVTIPTYSGTITNCCPIEEDDLNADWATERLPAVRNDTDERILLLHKNGDLVFRPDLPTHFAKRLRERNVDEDLRQHLWTHRQFQGDIRPQGAVNLHAAAMGFLFNFPEIKTLYQDAYSEAKARSSLAPHDAMMGSPASASAPASMVITPVARRLVLEQNVRGLETWSSLVILWPELPDGADNDRMEFRVAVSIATAKTLDALCCKVFENGEVNIPAVGTLRQMPYDEIFLIFASLHGAKSVEQQVAAGKLFFSILCDRRRGIGQELASAAPRRIGVDQFPPLRLKPNGPLRARPFAVPVVQKVTLDRRALAKRGAKWATLALLSHLMGDNSRTRTLSQIVNIESAIDPNKLDPGNDKYRPHPPKWNPSWPASADALEQLRAGTQDIVRAATDKWDRERRSQVCAVIDALFEDAEVVRLAQLNLRALPSEYEGLAIDIKQKADELRMREEQRKKKPLEEFENSLARPMGTKPLEKLVYSVNPLAARDGLRGKAHESAKASFSAHRIAAVAEKLHEQHKQYSRRGEGKAHELITKIEYEVGENGPYRSGVHKGWERERHPAPNITRLYCSETEFADMYYEAGVLEEKLRSGVISIKEQTFRQAISALSKDIGRALNKGEQGFGDLVAAAEAYFFKLFEKRWQDLHISGAVKLEETIAEAATRINQAQGIVERLAQTQSIRLRSDYKYCELPADDPGRERLQQVVEKRVAGTNFAFVTAVRRGESAIILLSLQSALFLDDVVPLRSYRDAYGTFRKHLEAFHNGDPTALPIFASPWFEERVAEYDDEVAVIVNRSNGGDQQSGNHQRDDRPRNDPPGKTFHARYERRKRSGRKGRRRR